MSGEVHTLFLPLWVSELVSKRVLTQKIKFNQRSKEMR